MLAGGETVLRIERDGQRHHSGQIGGTGSAQCHRRDRHTASTPQPTVIRNRIRTGRRYRRPTAAATATVVGPREPIVDHR